MFSPNCVVSCTAVTSLTWLRVFFSCVGECRGSVSVGALISQWCVQPRAAAQCVPGATNEAVVTTPISTAVAYLVLAAVNDVWQARASKVGQHLCVPQFAAQRCENRVRVRCHVQQDTVLLLIQAPSDSHRSHNTHSLTIQQLRGITAWIQTDRFDHTHQTTLTGRCHSCDASGLLPSWLFSRNRLMKNATQKKSRTNHHGHQCNS